MLKVFSYISNLLKFPSLYRVFKNNARIQKEFMQRTVLADLASIKLQNDNSLSETDFKKIEYYYGNAVASILGESFCILRGQELTTKERTALSYLGALTGLFDDFFDEKNTQEEQIKLLIENPNEANAQNAHEKLFVQFWNRVHENTDHIELIKNHFYKVFNVQILSKKQRQGNLSKTEIEEITFEKGAASILFYRSVFGEITDDPEYKLLYALGSIGQLENDIFDVYKDSQNNIQTLVTNATHIANIRQKYYKLHQEICTQAEHLQYPKHNVQSFVNYATAIISRGYVCLDFLEKSERQSNGVFSPKDYERKQLICDMESKKNALLSLHYYAKY